MIPCEGAVIDNETDSMLTPFIFDIEKVFIIFDLSEIERGRIKLWTQAGHFLRMTPKRSPVLV